MILNLTDNGDDKRTMGIIYDTYSEALLRAQDARERWELFVRPVEVITRTSCAAIHTGWELEFDSIAADAYAINNGVILSVCATCGANLGERDPAGSSPGLSHGICPRCREYAMRDAKPRKTV